MKKNLLFLAALAASAPALFAASSFYPITEYVGDVTGISDNGKYAAILDDDDIISFMWCVDEPENFVQLKNVKLMDVTNDGVYVGSRYEKGRYYPGYYKDGAWTDIPIDINSLNTNMAMSVTPDGKYIGGYLMTKSADVATGSRYFPAKWTLNDEGDYELRCYNNFDLGDHQGMYITCISPDGQAMGGSMFWGFAAQLNAMVIGDELRLFDELSVKEVPWYYKGEIWGYENGYFINGFRDYSSTDTFNGMFFDCDTKGNFYGIRTMVEEITNEEEGTGVLKNKGCVYNYLTDEWTYNDQYNCFSCGIGTDVLFTLDRTVFIDGEKKDIVNYFDFDPQGLDVASISKCSPDGKVLGGVTREFSEAIMEYLYSPFMLVLDEPIVDPVGISMARINDNQTILLSRGRIDFIGGEGRVFDINGRLMGEGSTISLQPGAYVARIGNTSRKVVVK